MQSIETDPEVTKLVNHLGKMLSERKKRFPWSTHDDATEMGIRAMIDVLEALGHVPSWLPELVQVVKRAAYEDRQARITRRYLASKLGSETDPGRRLAIILTLPCIPE